MSSIHAELGEAIYDSRISHVFQNGADQGNFWLNKEFFLFREYLLSNEV